MARSLRVLLFDPSSIGTELFNRSLIRAGFEPEIVLTKTEAELKSGLEQDLDLVLLNCELPSSEDFLQGLHRKAPFIVFAQSFQEDLALSVLEAGASDFITTDQIARLGPAVWRALVHHKSFEQAETVQYLDCIINAIADPVFVKDDCFRFVLVNEALLKILGKSREELLGKTGGEFLPPEQMTHFLEVDREVLSRGEENLCEEKLTAADGTVRTIVTKKSRYVDSEGTRFIVGVIRDVTEARHTEDELEQAEKDVRRMEAMMPKMIANIGDVIAIIDGQGINRYKSPNIQRWFGWKPEELVGKNTWDNVHPDDLSKTQKFFAGLLEEKNAVGTTQCRYRCRDGSYKWIEFTGANLVHDPDIKGILGNYRDITKRKQAEQTLAESETRFKNLHNASFGGIAIHDKGMILECNQGLSNISGFTLDELIGMDGLLLIAEKSRDFVMDKILSGDEKPYEACGLRKNGEEYPLRLEARNVPYRGKMVRTVEFRDMTEQKKAEAERIKLQEQLNHAQKMESVGRLAGGIAHDFNNILGVILGYTEMAMERVEQSEPLFEDLLETRKAAERSADITRQLLTFARKQTLAPRVLDLNQTVEGMLKMLRRLIGEDIHLAWKPCDKLWPIRFDPSQLSQILTNLCINARDAITGVGEINIETAVKVLDQSFCDNLPDCLPGEYVQLKVADNGEGMDSVTRNNIFEPFFTTKGLGEGTGLGLAMVYGAVKQNGGFITVTSEAGKGSCFTINIPRHVDNAEQLAEDIDAAESEMRGKETILLVEDEPAILKMTTKMLKRQGYAILAATSPEEGLQIAQIYSGKIHLLVTDVIMPGMNGSMLADNVSDVYPDIKCLFMSGYTANVIAPTGVLDKGVNFIQKPFALKALAAKVRSIIDSD